MATYSASVQSTSTGTREHCAADPEKLATIGRAINQQVRIKFDNQYAIYTVKATSQENPENIVRMTTEGASRLGQSVLPFSTDANIDSQVVHPTFTTDAEAKSNSEFVELLSDNGTHTGLIAIAPHGGNIEPGTYEQAIRVASQLAAKNVSSWCCNGYKQGGGAYDRWHITSTDINEASFPRLNTIINRKFNYAVAFHGFSNPKILIGGAADKCLKEKIKLAIENAIAGSGIPVEIAVSGDDYGGDSPKNIVNRLSNGNGIQIEQSSKARQDYGMKIADAVASVFDSKINFA